MVSSIQDIEKKNSEAELSTIKAEIDEKVLELTSLLTQSASLKQERTDFEKEKETFAAYKKDQEGIISSSRSDIARELVNFESQKELKAKELKSLSFEVREVNKLLSRANVSCLNAEEEIVKLLEKKTQIEDRIGEMVLLVANYEKLKTSIKESEDVLVILKADISTKKQDSDLDLKNARENLASIRNEAQVVILERDKVEYELKNFTDMLYQKRVDYNVILSRIEGHWDKTFPELELPLQV